MTNGNDQCANCGGDQAIHHYQTNQCPVGGVESPIGREQEWKTTTFECIPFSPPERLAKDASIREYIATAALQGLLANPNYTDRIINEGWYEDATIDAVQQADNLIKQLNQETK